MDNKQLSLSGILKLAGCILFDTAMIIAFFNIFALFSLISPVKSSLMLFVLLVGLCIVNGTLFLPGIFSKKIGTVYSTAIIIISILYAITANLISASLIYGYVVWYVVWEIILLSVYLMLISVLVFFSKKASVSADDIRNEQDESLAIKMQILKIDSQIASISGSDSREQIQKSFKTLKERINASSPFGRIVNNGKITSLEGEIKNNLNLLLLKIQANVSTENISDIQKLMEDTRNLVIIREVVNIK